MGSFHPEMVSMHADIDGEAVYDRADTAVTSLVTVAL
jgi:hypothetical protein